MSDDIPVIPEEVPEFTGNLEQLDLGIAGVRSAGTSLKDSGSAIHTRFAQRGTRSPRKLTVGLSRRARLLGISSIHVELRIFTR